MLVHASEKQKEASRPATLDTMSGRRANRVALLGLVAASSFGVALLSRLLARFDLVIDPGVEVSLALVTPLLLYPWLRPKRANDTTAAAGVASRQVVVAAALDVEEEPHAGL